MHSRTRLSNMLCHRQIWIKPNSQIFDRRVRNYINITHFNLINLNFGKLLFGTD